VSRPVVGVLVASLVLLAGGCATGTDDEMAPAPTRTVTATPSQSVAPAPATVPVGHGNVSPADVVWAQGSELHVGDRSVDLSPVEVDAFVVVEGGVFVLSGDELWFTDLSRLRGTGQTDLTQVRVNTDATRLVVTDTRSGRPLDQAYDTGTGKAIRGEVETLTPDQQRSGPGRYDLKLTSGGTAHVVEAATGDTMPVTPPARFDVGRWLDDSTFVGTGEPQRGHVRVVRCKVDARTCSVLGARPTDAPVVFGTGK
jgi:hypothetical protein